MAEEQNTSSTNTNENISQNYGQTVSTGEQYQQGGPSGGLPAEMQYQSIAGIPDNLNSYLQQQHNSMYNVIGNVYGNLNESINKINSQISEFSNLIKSMTPVGLVPQQAPPVPTIEDPSTFVMQLKAEIDALKKGVKEDYEHRAKYYGELEQAQLQQYNDQVVAYVEEHVPALDQHLAYHGYPGFADIGAPIVQKIIINHPVWDQIISHPTATREQKQEVSMYIMRELCTPQAWQHIFLTDVVPMLQNRQKDYSSRQNVRERVSAMELPQNIVNTNTYLQ